MPALVVNPLLRALSLYAAARVIPAAVSFAFTVLCVQSLSSQQYGEYSLILLPATLAASFVGGLAGQPMLRFGLDLTPSARSFALKTLPLAGAGVAMPLVLGYFVWSGRPAGTIWFALALVPLVAMLDTRRALFVAASNASEVFWLDGVRAVLSLGVLAVALQIGTGSSAIPLVALSSGALAALLLVPAKRASLSEGTLAVDRGYVWYGFWVACWMVVVGLAPLSERLVIERQFGLAAAGEYATIADPLGTIMAAVAGVLVGATMPRYVAAWSARDPAQLRRLTLIAAASIVAVGFLCLCIGLILASTGWGRWSEVIRGSPATSIALLVATVVWQIGVFLHKPLELVGATHVMLGCVSVALLCFLLIVIPMASLAGPLGVAGAKLLSGTLYIGLVVYWGRRLAKGIH